MNHFCALRWITFACLFFTQLSATPVVLADNPDPILTNVKTIAAPGAPGTLALFSPDARVIVDAVLSKNVRVPVVACSTFGKGLFYAFGHDGYFNPSELDKFNTGQLLANILSQTKTPKILVLKNKPLEKWLMQKGHDVTTGQAEGWVEQLSKCNIVFVTPSGLSSKAQVLALQEFVQNGNTVIVAACGWGWQSLNPKKTLANDLLANDLLLPAGIAFGDGYANKEDDSFPISLPAQELLNAHFALDKVIQIGKSGLQLVGNQKAELNQCSQTVLDACRVVSGESGLMKRVAGLEKGQTVRLPSPGKGLGLSDSLSRIILVNQLQKIARLPIEQLSAHPAASIFPGSVPPNTAKVEKTIVVSTSVPRWHSTGTYAIPGEFVEVLIADAMVKTGYRIRVGCHTDKTFHLSSWHRAPDISRAFSCDQKIMRVGNAFGGLIYVEVPEKAVSAELKVTIKGAVEAPLFVLGKTPIEQWKTIRNAPGPWAELATSKVILTMKSEAVRNLEDPTEVMRHWDRVMDADATLAGWAIDRKSPERIVSDADISAGYMHSGYPIMTGLDVTMHFADLKVLHSLDGGWGFYHELGHNHQSSDWTFEGTGEVTVNLFTMYVLETVCGLSKEQATSRSLKDQKKINAYLAKPDFEKWKDDAFLALAMYSQIRLEFGWEPFKTVMADYRQLAGNERPKSQQDKRDQWMIRMSKATGKNLGPFFDRWGVPVTAGAKDQVKGLEGWMPAGM